MDPVSRRRRTAGIRGSRPPNIKSPVGAADIWPMEPLPLGEDTAASSSNFLTRLRTNLSDPTVLALPLVAIALCLLRWLHVIALEPYWVYIAVLIGSGLLRAAYSAAWEESGRPWYRSGYIAIYMSVIALVAYCTGWGPILSIGFLFGAATAFEVFGSKATVPCLLWTTICMTAGQVAIALHVAPTIIHEPVVQGVAALGLLGALLVINLLGQGTARRESLEAELRAVGTPLFGSRQQLQRYRAGCRGGRVGAVRQPRLRVLARLPKQPGGQSPRRSPCAPRRQVGLRAAMGAAGESGAGINKEIRLRRSTERGCGSRPPSPI